MVRQWVMDRLHARTFWGRGDYALRVFFLHKKQPYRNGWSHNVGLGPPRATRILANLTTSCDSVGPYDGDLKGERVFVDSFGRYFDDAKFDAHVLLCFGQRAGAWNDGFQDSRADRLHL